MPRFMQVCDSSMWLLFTGQRVCAEKHLQNIPVEIIVSLPIAGLGCIGELV